MSEWEEGQGERELGGWEVDRWGGKEGDQGTKAIELPNPMCLTTAGFICLINCVETGVSTNAANV